MTPEQQELQARRELRVLKASKVPPEPQVLKDLQVPRVLLARMVRTDLMVPQVPQVLPEPQALKVRQALRPTLVA